MGYTFDVCICSFPLEKCIYSVVMIMLIPFVYALGLCKNVSTPAGVGRLVMFCSTLSTSCLQLFRCSVVLCRFPYISSHYPNNFILAFLFFNSRLRFLCSLCQSLVTHYLSAFCPSHPPPSRLPSFEYLLVNTQPSSHFVSVYILLNMCRHEHKSTIV